MNAEELKSKYESLYKYMANSNEPDNMKAFGKVTNEMMDWMIANKPEAAAEWIDKLSAIMWKNYLTPKEADTIVSKMEPKAPWNREQWKGAMEQHGFETENEPHYNSCALFTAMNMIMSDSGNTLKKYVNDADLFKVVYDLAVDKLTDRDGVFAIRRYFGV